MFSIDVASADDPRDPTQITPGELLRNQVPKTPSKHRLQAVDSASLLNRIERVRETVVFGRGGLLASDRP
jgi:hypothetical protein